METTAENLINHLNQPVMIQDGFTSHMGVVLAVTEREDGNLDVPLHFEDSSYSFVTVVEVPKTWPVMIVENEGE